jgi:hypothetical protein
VVADPPQTHLRPEEQQAILIPHRLLTTGSGIGLAFDRVHEQFRLRHGVTVTLFRRARAISPGDFDAFCDELKRAHPDRPFVYRPPGPVDEMIAAPE